MKKSRVLQDHECKHLPLEITSEILIRLPINTLVRCKCVCKSWRHLLSEDHFKNKYMEMSKSRSGLIFKTWIPERIKPDLYFYKYNFSAASGSSSCYMLGESMDDMTRLKDSCNGLVLLVRHTIYCVCFVCNPMTRETIELPHLKIYGTDIQRWSLVHDYRTGKYKVFCGGSLASGSKCFILTVGVSKSWRKVPFPKTFTPRNVPPVFANGALHWMCWKPSTMQGLEGCIVSIDVNREAFQEIRKPDCHSKKCFLLEMDGSLCYVDLLSNRELDVWILEDMKDQIWIKRHRVKLDLVAMGVKLQQSHWPIPLVIVNCLEPLMVFAWPRRSNLFAYNFKKKEVKETGLVKRWCSQSMELLDGPNGNFHLISHVNSFASWG